MAATRAVYDQVPWLTEQFTAEYGQVLLGLQGWDNHHLGTTDPRDTVEDLKGVKIGAAGPNLPWLEYAGAVPVQSTLPDGYLSLQTGVYHGLKFYEPSPNYTLTGFGAMAVNALAMNQRSLDRLPEDVRKIIIEVGRAYEDQAGASLNAAQQRGLDGLKEVGANIKTLTEEARAGRARARRCMPMKRQRSSST